MTRLVHAPAGAYQKSPANKIQRELGPNVRVAFTQAEPHLWWCELRLPVYRFTTEWVCSPGETHDKALEHAISNARRHVKMVAS